MAYLNECHRLFIQKKIMSITGVINSKIYKVYSIFIREFMKITIIYFSKDTEYN